MDSIWVGIIAIIVSIIFGSMAIVTSIIAAVWLISNRFSAVEARLTGVETVTLAQNHRLEMMEGLRPIEPIAPRRKR